MDRSSMPTTPFDESYPLSKADMVWFAEQYTRDARDAANPLCSVIRADRLSDLPPTILVLAVNDPLYAEGLAFGERLAAENNGVIMLEYATLPHAFTAMSGGLPRARAALIEIARALAAHPEFSVSKAKHDDNGR
jgi:acetyl esterase/lipase